MTNPPEIAIRLAAGQSRFSPGDLVEGNALVEGETSLGRVELSVLWYTAGKGDSASGVVHFEVLSDGGERSSIHRPFSVRLPLVPHSYEGTLLAIRWVVRVRICALFGDDLVVDRPFVVSATDAT